MKIKSFLSPFTEDKKFNANIILTDGNTTVKLVVGDSVKLLQAVINYDVVNARIIDNELNVLLKNATV
jgi:hypothetical protein